MKKHHKILLYVFTFSIFTFVLLPELILGTPASPAVGNWYQQFLPNLGSQQINDIIFLDSLKGFAISSKNVNPDSSSILRTTNGGDTWQIIQMLSPRMFSRIKFVNNLTGFISGGSGSGTPFLYKTSDGGNNWSVVAGASLGNAIWNDMAILNEDSIWLVDNNSFNGGVYRTTNGGANWDHQLNLGSQNPSKIYMYNGRIGFASTGAGLYKTTNSGNNWNNISGNGTFFDMYFKDSLNGWKSRQLIDNTTDGGITWITQTLPSGGNIILNYLLKFAYTKTDTIFGVGGLAIVPNGARGFIYRSINGGNTWEYQIPDTSIHAPQYQYIRNINNNLWAYWFLSGIHTTNGGDPVWLTGIEQISSEIPKEFRLYQNYPNPFNPVTNIKYQVMPNVKGEMSNVKLVVFDITGKEIIKLVDDKQTAGTYKVDWDAAGYSSGIYFFSLIINSSVIDSKKMILIK